MKLYTRTGDDGNTGLYGGGRVPKCALRVAAYGEVDELNAVLGWCLLSLGAPLIERGIAIQHALFGVGAELASAPANPVGGTFVPIEADQVATLEHWIDESCAVVQPLRTFILPGGSEGGARLHLARVVCRRAERAVIHLAQSEPLRPVVIQYLNRLSDLLFAWARQFNADSGRPETPWRARTPDDA